MTMKKKLGWIIMLMAILSVAWLGQTGKASAQTIHSPSLSPSASTTLFGCSFRTLTGFYLTAVSGGGRTTDVIESNRTVANAWEKFTLVPMGAGNLYALETSNGFFLTAEGGGGRTTDVIHSILRNAEAWETFALISLGGDLFAIRTFDQTHFLTAVGEGGRTTDVIHSNATQIQAWEEFHVNCN